MRNPARASRSLNSVIRLSLVGTMFATVVKRRWSSLTARHGWFGCAVHGLLHGGETCRVRVAERRRAPVVCAALFVLRQPHLLVPGVALASVSAAAFILLCAATAGAFGTVVVVHSSFDLADGGFTRMSVFVTLIVSAGVFTLVDFYFHFAGLQPAFEGPQQQAAAAGGVTMPQRRRLHHGWTWVTTLRRQASICNCAVCVCGHSSKVTRYRCPTMEVHGLRSHYSLTAAVSSSGVLATSCHSTVEDHR